MFVNCEQEVGMEISLQEAEEVDEDHEQYEVLYALQVRIFPIAVQELQEVEEEQSTQVPDDVQ